MRIIFLVLIVFLTGCAANGPIYERNLEQSSSEATVYFYRPYNLYGGGYAPVVFVDGSKKFRLKYGGYNFVVVQPGSHQFLLKANGVSGLQDIPFSMQVEGGKTYFLRLSTQQDNDLINKMGMAVSGTIAVHIVSEEIANKELAATHLSQ